MPGSAADDRDRCTKPIDVAATRRRWRRWDRTLVTMLIVVLLAWLASTVGVVASLSRGGPRFVLAQNALGIEWPDCPPSESVPSEFQSLGPEKTYSVGNGTNFGTGLSILWFTRWEGWKYWEGSWWPRYFTPYDIRRRVFYLPLWLPASLPVLIWGGVYLVIGRAARRMARGRCIRCAYDLTGNLSGVCPECGQPCAGWEKLRGRAWSVIAGGRTLVRATVAVVRSVVVLITVGAGLLLCLGVAGWVVGQQGPTVLMQRGFAEPTGWGQLPPATLDLIVKDEIRGKIKARQHSWFFNCSLSSRGDYLIAVDDSRLAITYCDEFSWQRGWSCPHVGLMILAVFIGLFTLPMHYACRQFRYLGVRHGCEGCGYDLTGNTSGTCPECGEAIVR